MPRGRRRFRVTIGLAILPVNELDEVAYLRFMVYRSFSSANDFAREIESFCRAHRNLSAHN